MPRPRLYKTDEERKAAHRTACQKYDRGPKRETTRQARKSRKAAKRKAEPITDPIRRFIREELWSHPLAVDSPHLSQAQIRMPTMLAGFNAHGLLARKIRFTDGFSNAFQRPIRSTELLGWIDQSSYARPQVDTRLLDVTVKTIRDAMNGYHLRTIVDKAHKRLAPPFDVENQLEATKKAVAEMRYHLQEVEKSEAWIAVAIKDPNPLSGEKAIALAEWWLYWQWQAILVLRNELHMRWLHDWKDLEPIIEEVGWIWQRGWQADSEVRAIVQRTSRWALLPASDEELDHDSEDDDDDNSENDITDDNRFDG